MARYKNLGGTHRFAVGEVPDGELKLASGAEFERDENDKRPFPPHYARIERVRKAAPAEPQEPTDEEKGKVPAPPSEAAKTKGNKPPAESVDVSQYHQGGNKYDIPGVGVVRGKKAAMEALRARGAN